MDTPLSPYFHWINNYFETKSIYKSLIITNDELINGLYYELVTNDYPIENGYNEYAIQRFSSNKSRMLIISDTELIKHRITGTHIDTTDTIVFHIIREEDYNTEKERDYISNVGKEIMAIFDGLQVISVII